MPDRQLVLTFSLFGFILLLTSSCISPGGLFSFLDPPPSACLEQFGANEEWSNESEVHIDGYSAHAMEPKLSADESQLFWNDKPASDDEMNIHYAVKQPSGRYLYKGTLPGSVSPQHLDGVPALDTSGNFYFVSTRNYTTNFQTLFGGRLVSRESAPLEVFDVAPIDPMVSEKKLGTVDMDLDVSWDGTLLVVSRARFSGRPFPEESRLAIFKLSARNASPHSEANAWLAEVNRPECRTYAGNLSKDKLELYYTILPLGSRIGPDDFRIVVSKRKSLTDAFTKGEIISGIRGQFTEGPAVSYRDGGTSLIYHRRDPKSKRLKIYRVSRNRAS